MNPEWYNAAHPATAVVLKRRLRPYSLGHELLLCGQGVLHPTSLEDLSLCALICSLTYEEGAELVAGGFNKPSFKFFMWVWTRMIGKRFELHNELAVFWQYRKDALWMPEPEDNKPGRNCGSPYAFRLLAKLMSYFGWSESLALNYPLSRATAVLCAGLESDGVLKLFDMSAADEVLAALEAQEKKGWEE